MRIQCPRCQALAEVTRFTTTTDPPRIEFRCSSCGEQVSEAARDESAPRAGSRSESEPEAASPGAREPSRDGEPSSALSSASREEGTDPLWNGWDRVTERFDEAARHDAFLAACEVADALPFAAARYREWAESHPEDHIAPPRLKRIAALAEARVMLATSRRERDKDPVRQAVILGVLLLALLAIVVLTAPLLFRGVSGREGPRSGAERSAPGDREPALQNLKRIAPRATPRPPADGSPRRPVGVGPPEGRASAPTPGSPPPRIDPRRPAGPEAVPPSRDRP